jgi:hypothetical protein
MRNSRYDCRHSVSWHSAVSGVATLGSTAWLRDDAVSGTGNKNGSNAMKVARR